jgi:hypothetical protein
MVMSPVIDPGTANAQKTLPKTTDTFQQWADKVARASIPGYASAQDANSTLSNLPHYLAAAGWILVGAILFILGVAILISQSKLGKMAVGASPVGKVAKIL